MVQVRTSLDYESLKNSCHYGGSKLINDFSYLWAVDDVLIELMGKVNVQ